MKWEGKLDLVLILLLGFSAAITFFSILGVIKAVSWLFGGAG